MSHIMRKTAFCICENKDADQLPGNWATEPRLFCYIHSIIPLLPQSEILSLYPTSVAVQLSLCQTWSETPNTGFLKMRLAMHKVSFLIM